MKKLVKITLIIVVLVMGLTFGLSMSNDTQKDISLDFNNSGQPEWSDVVELKINKRQYESFFGFKNSGLPETIEIHSL